MKCQFCFCLFVFCKAPRINMNECFSFMSLLCRHTNITVEWLSHRHQDSRNCTRLLLQSENSVVQVEEVMNSLCICDIKLERKALPCTSQCIWPALSQWNIVSSQKCWNLSRSFRLILWVKGPQAVPARLRRAICEDTNTKVLHQH